MSEVPGGDAEDQTQQDAGGTTQPVESIRQAFPGLSPMGEWAVRYAQVGIHVLPLHHPTDNGCSCENSKCGRNAGKHPRHSKWEAAASNDANVIAEYWRQYPNANIGWAVGRDGLIVIDCDHKESEHGGLYEVEQYMAGMNDGLPATLTARSGSGGEHLVFRLPKLPKGATIKNRRVLPDVDIRTSGGQIVVAPSTHRSGGRYEWVDGFDLAKVVELPDSLLRLAMGSSKGSSRTRAVTGGQMPGGGSENRYREVKRSGHGPAAGDRDGWFNQFIYEMRRLNLSPEAAELELRKRFETTEQPPGDEYTWEQVAEKLTRIWSEVDPDAAGQPDTWEPPVPLLSQQHLPLFPVHALAPAPGDMVAAVAEAVQVPVDLPAVIALSAFNASLAGRVKLAVREGYTEPASLYALGLIESGNRKSSTIKELTAPLLTVQAQLRESMKPVIQEAKAQLAVLKTIEAGLKTQLKRHPDDVDIQKRVEKAVLDVAIAAASVPELLTLIVDDATPESLVQLMAANGERLAVFDAEGGGLITMTGARYSENSYIDLLLKAHSGDAVSSSRVSRGAVSMGSPSLTIGVLTQPEVLRELRGVASAEGRGLLGRFLIASPREILGHRKMEPKPVPAETSGAYALLLSAMAVNLWSAPPVTVPMDDAARRRLLDYARVVEDQLVDDGELRPLGGFAGKLVGAAARYALLHHLSHYGVPGLVLPVTAASVECGILIADYSVEHYRYAMRAAGMSDYTALAERALRWIASRVDGGQYEFSKRELTRGLGNGVTAKDAGGVIELLVEHGYCRSKTTPHRSGSGQPASPMYEVNLLSVNSVNGKS